MNKFAEIVKTHKAEIVKGAVVIVGSSAGLAIGLGILDNLNPSYGDLDSDVDTTDTPETSDSTNETD